MNRLKEAAARVTALEVAIRRIDNIIDGLDRDMSARIVMVGSAARLVEHPERQRRLQEREILHNDYLRARADLETARAQNGQETPSRKGRTPSKRKLGEIYDWACSRYQDHRTEYGQKNGTSHGADEAALEATCRDIQKQFHIRVRPRNLKEALTRRLSRTRAHFAKE